MTNMSYAYRFVSYDGIVICLSFAANEQSSQFVCLLSKAYEDLIPKEEQFPP